MSFHAHAIIAGDDLCPNNYTCMEESLRTRLHYMYMYVLYIIIHVCRALTRYMYHNYCYVISEWEGQNCEWGHYGGTLWYMWFIFSIVVSCFWGSSVLPSSTLSTSTSSPVSCLYTSIILCGTYMYMYMTCTCTCTRTCTCMNGRWVAEKHTLPSYFNIEDIDTKVDSWNVHMCILLQPFTVFKTCSMYMYVIWL